MNELRKRTEEKLLMAAKELEIAHTECVKVMEQYENLKIDYEQLRLRNVSQQKKEVLLRESQVYRFVVVGC